MALRLLRCEFPFLKPASGINGSGQAPVCESGACRSLTDSRAHVNRPNESGCAILLECKKRAAIEAARAQVLPQRECLLAGCMNHDVTAADRRPFRQRAVGARVELVIVDGDILLKARVVVPNLDPKAVSPCAGGLPIDGGEEELVVAGAVERAGALELGACLPSDHHPVIRIAVEIEISALEQERGGSGGNFRSFLIFRDEAERCSARRGYVGLVGA